jgi:predicted RNase H-like nuclease (RuvC/YqgF family)
MSLSEAKTNLRDHEEVLAQIMQMDAEIRQAESLLQEIHNDPSKPYDTEKDVRELSSLTDLLRHGAEEIRVRRERLSGLLAEIRDTLGLSEQIKPLTVAVGQARA